MLKAILFDVDGTLAETEEFHRRAFNSAFAHAQLDVCWSVAEYRQLLKVTGGKERLRAYFDARGLAVSDRDLQGLHRSKNEHYARNLETGAASLRPGVLRLMQQVRDAGLMLGIATTTSLVNVDALLRYQLGRDWRQLFSCLSPATQDGKSWPPARPRW